MKNIGVILVGDHTLVRSGIRSVLQGLDGVRVLAEATDEQGAANLIASQRSKTILVDIMVPELSKLEAIQRILKKLPETPIIILSLQTNEEYAWQALRAGVTGYLQNEAGVPELELAIRAVSRGQTYLSPAISKHVVGKYVRQQSEDVLSEKVTPRQQEILKMIVEGLSTREIARRLNISVRTVETHRFHLMERLGIRNVAGLVRFAMQSGLVKSRE